MKIRGAQGILVAAALAAAACGGHSAAPSASTPAAPLSTPLAVAERSSQTARTELAGTVAAEKTTAVSSRVMAMVTAVEAQLGDSVRAGQVLVRIDPAVAQGQVAQARGALAQAQAGLALAARNHERFQNLAASHAASALELDLATMQFEQAKGAVEQAEGAVAAATSVARESQVVAPFAGRVAQRLVEVGDLAAPGRPLVMLESAEGRRLVLAVSEGLAQAAQLAVGQILPVRIDARAELGEIAGRIVELSPGPDPQSHTFTVKVDLGAAAVPAGAAGRAYLPAGERAAVLVPAAALIEAGGLTLVVVRDSEGRAESRVVAVGDRRGDGRVEVLSGLAGGESVAVGLAAAPPAGTPLVEGRS